MGRVKYTAQKKKPPKPSENQPAPNAEIPLTSGMPADRAIDLYAKSANKKKSHKRQSGEGCSNPSTKRSQTEDPPVPTPTKEKTHPPAPTRETTLPFPVNQDPPSPVGRTPSPAPADLTPPASTIQ
ncbi:extensin-like [Humulus lupulus]|uniref:extensin-like n=1 Tax=Humulus lupulus TaxID=3486 RepID=UPI002B408D86|nr:extensin-like [Humulus lupulus]